MSRSIRFLVQFLIRYLVRCLAYIFIYLICSTRALASGFEIFFDPLIWRASESIDWVLDNDARVTNQNISYQTIEFDFAPGFRVGCGFDLADWDSRIYYTHYQTIARDRAQGNLVSTFLGGKLAQSIFFFRTGQVRFKIDLNMFDWDFGKNFVLNDSLVFHPYVGVRAGGINQSVTTTFQGPISLTERVKNNFLGIGPKLGIGFQWLLYCVHDHQFSLFTDVAASCLWGRWHIQDVAQDNLSRTFDTKVGKRNFGAFTAQAFVGLNVDCGCFSTKFGYEIADWFNQYQVLDDGTGGHNDNLLLQGISLRFAYAF